MTNAELQLLVARIDTRLEGIEKNADLVREAMQDQGKAIAGLPCVRHERRLSEMTKAVNKLQTNGAVQVTRLQTAWTAVKIVATAGAAIAGIAVAVAKLL